ncbi:MAG: hypothetical protein NTV32_03855 [Gammaproteobacteria bacterium]|nr:hypothetical protein [Gammaproteobacteria bacterium]
MVDDRAILHALDLPLFILRQLEAVVPMHRFIVLVEEVQAVFDVGHQAQLQKIMAYLNQTDYVLLFADSDLNCKAPILLHFGALASYPQANQIVKTHSISTMLAEPASKKQVLHDLQSLKSG